MAKPTGAAAAAAASAVTAARGSGSIAASDRPPVKDIVTVVIPIDVTVDLGVAMKRNRAKRIRKIKELFPELAKGGCGATERKKPKKKGGGAAAGGSDSGEENKHELVDEKKNKMDFDGDEEMEDGEDDERAASSPGTGLRREDYGSVLDYLEAKYVRGVQIGMEGPPNGEGDNGGNGMAGDLSDDDSGGNRSVYSDASGNFLDDSMLRHDVAEQVIATGKYGGSTKVEEELRKDRLDQGEGGRGLFDDATFFVNVGELELADEGGCHDAADIDWNAAAALGEKKKKAKRKASKRKKKEEPVAAASSVNSSSSSSVVNNEKEEPTKKKSKKNPSKASKSPKKKTESANVATAKKNTSKNSKKKAGSKAEDGGSTIEAPALSTEALQLAADSAKFKALSDKLFKVCLREIKKCTEEHIPRKKSTGKRAKVSVPVPVDKGPGEELLFFNPHIPEQKLKLRIPQKWNREKSKGKIQVTVRLPAKDEMKNNDFPRPLKDALAEYSQAFDDWLDAEAKYRNACPQTMFKKDSFKPGTERLGKFDKMLKFFPKEKDLIEPCDAPFLRKIVRRVRQANQKKRKATGSGPEKAATSGAGGGKSGDGGQKKSSAPKKRQIEAKLAELDDNAPSSTLEIQVPGKNQSFPNVQFNSSDFNPEQEGGRKGRR